MQVHLRWSDLPPLRPAGFTPARPYESEVRPEAACRALKLVAGGRFGRAERSSLYCTPERGPGRSIREQQRIAAVRRGRLREVPDELGRKAAQAAAACLLDGVAH